VARLNADLANDLGNLVSRSLTMAQKYFKGDLPEPGPSQEEDEELKRSALELIGIYEGLIEDLALHKALMAIWEVIGKVNRYIDFMAPWVLAKSDRERLATVICHIFETLRIIAALIWPFIPGSAEKIQEQLGLSKKGKDFTLEKIKRWGREKPVRTITKVPALFPRIEKEKKEKQSKPSAPEKKKASSLPLISFDDFQKIDLRIGKITEAKAIPGSKKLIKLKVDIGEERTVVAGLKGHYTEEGLIGTEILLVVNLAPVKLMGVESHGMLLAASDEAGLHLLVPDASTVPGSKVK